jgi:hypothetical protein
MFYDIEKFPFLKEIVRNADELADEFFSQMQLPFMADFISAPLPGLNSHTEHWIRENGLESTQTGYDTRDGSWASLPVYKKGFPIKWYDVDTAFPKIISSVLSVPGVNFAAFFKITPGSGTKEHAHQESNLIFHLCLSDVGGESVMNCNGHEKIISKKGDWCIFDYSLPHSSFNHGKNDRINLVIDFDPIQEYAVK